MQVRHLAAAALLSLTAVAAMSQELDPRNDRMFNHPSAATGYRGPVAADPTSQPTKTADTAAAPATGATTQGVAAKAPAANVGAQKPAHKDVVGLADPAAPLSRAQVKSELAAWRSTHKVVVGELG